MVAKRKRKGDHDSSQASYHVKKEDVDVDWKAFRPSCDLSADGSSDSTLYKSTADTFSPKVEPDLDEPPLKKRRMVIEVVMPTWQEVLERKLNQAALDKMSKIKKKEADLKLDDTIRNDRLALIDNHVFDIKVPTAIREQLVTREFMARTYGGSMQATRPTIGRAMCLRHHYRNFAYLHVDYHPHAPGVPGHPGLFYGTKSGRNWEGEHRVFVKDPKKALWGYQGQYAFESGPPLSIEEWKVHTNRETRAHWATQICRQKWGHHVRSRIQARRELGRAGTVEEVEAVKRSGRWQDITPLDVMQAYDCGDEVIGVWILKCVGYDEVFQRELCNKFPRWVKPPGKVRGAKPQKRQNRKRPGKTAATTERSEHEDESDNNTSESEIDNEDSFEEEEVDEEELFLLRRRGTKSRPIVL